MLTTYSKPQFVEKIITSQTGEQFRVTFLVAIVAGEMKAKVVSMMPLARQPVTASTQSATSRTVLSLAAPFEKIATAFTYSPAFAPVISPYTILEFFVSQPTRAPSFN